MPYPSRPISSAITKAVPYPAKGSKTTCPFFVNSFMQYSTRLSAARTFSWRNLDGKSILFPRGKFSHVCAGSTGLVFRFALFEYFNRSVNALCPRLFTLCLRGAGYLCRRAIPPYDCFFPFFNISIVLTIRFCRVSALFASLIHITYSLRCV